MSTMIELFGPGEIIFTRDLDGLVVRMYVVTPKGELKPITKEDL